MSFDLFAQQTALLDRLATIDTDIAIADTFGEVIVTDASGKKTGAQLMFIDFSPVDQTGGSALHTAHWAFDVYVDVSRASDAEKTAAAALFSAALAALVGYEIQRGRAIRTAAGQDSGFDQRVLRISFGFTVPVYLAGT